MLRPLIVFVMCFVAVFVCLGHGYFATAFFFAVMAWFSGGRACQ
jgi:hypothetical protein